MRSGQGVNGAVQRLVAFSSGLDPLQFWVAFDVAGDQALAGDLLEHLGVVLAADVNVAGPRLGVTQAPVDFGLGGVGADGPPAPQGGYLMSRAVTPGSPSAGGS